MGNRGVEPTLVDGVKIARGACVPESPRVSVIVPAFESPWLEEALASVRAQGCAELEIVVVDDGAPVPIAPRKTDDLVMVRQSNTGPGGARNRGVEIARGEWVAFIDSDDRWTPGKLEAQMALHDAHPKCILSCGDSRLDDGSAQPTVSMPPEHRRDGYQLITFERLFLENRVACSTAMVRRDAYRRAGGMPAHRRLAEDYALWLRLAQQGSVAFIDRVLCVRRPHDNSLTATSRRAGDFVRQEREVYEEFLAEYPSLRNEPFVATAFARLDAEETYQHLENGAFHMARKTVRQLVRRHPGSAWTWRMLARAYLGIGSRHATQ